MSLPSAAPCTLQVMAPSTARPWNGPKAPRIRSALPGDTYTTRRCSTDPPPGKLSHQQPPARASNERFAAFLENVWSEFHQCDGNSRAEYTLSGAAATWAVSRTSNPLLPTLTTSAAARPAAVTASANAAE